MKANWLLDKVSPWNNNDKGTAEEEFSLSKLKNCFSQIKVLIIVLLVYFIKKKRAKKQQPGLPDLI